MESIKKLENKITELNNDKIMKALLLAQLIEEWSIELKKETITQIEFTRRVENATKGAHEAFQIKSKHIKGLEAAIEIMEE